MTGLSLTQAAARTGKSRRTIGRLLADGKIPGAEQKDGVWSIPLEGLATAGLLDEKRKAKPAEDVADDSQPLTWRERALIAEAKLEATEKALTHSQDNRQVLEQLLARLSSRSVGPVVTEATVAEPFTRTVPDMATEPVPRPAPKVTEQDKRRGWFARK